jgi:negative regulator of sigma E activity
MNDRLYDLWIQRANAGAPADFADRVMDAVRREPLPSSKGVRVRLLSSPAVRVAACVLAFLACVYRMAAVVAVFFVQ